MNLSLVMYMIVSIEAAMVFDIYPLEINLVQVKIKLNQ